MPCALLVFVPRRMTAPPAQRRPSPNTLPAPRPICVVPWKNSAELFAGICAPHSCAVSLEIETQPVARSLPPIPNEFRQPSTLPGRLLFAHGHAVPLPSPAQNAVPIAGRDGVKQYAYDAVQSCSHVWSVFGSNAPRYAACVKKPSFGAVATLVSASLAGRGSRNVTFA